MIAEELEGGELGKAQRGLGMGRERGIRADELLRFMIVVVVGGMRGMMIAGETKIGRGRIAQEMIIDRRGERRGKMTGGEIGVEGGRGVGVRGDIEMRGIGIGGDNLVALVVLRFHVTIYHPSER